MGFEFLMITQTRLLILAACLGMCFDFLSGFANACMHHEVSSEKMRIGLWHKLGFLGCIALGIYIEWLQGISDIASYIGVELPTTAAICIVICVIEIVSIYENIKKINPQVVKTPLDVLHNEDESDEE